MGDLTRPLIGVTSSELRRQQATRPLKEADPPQVELALGLPYLQAVERAGGLPVALPPLNSDAVRPLLSRLSGVCLSGGPDLDPSFYGAEPHPELGPREPELDAFELAVAREADALGIPVLGICRGCQVLNVARGGTLHQHLPDAYGTGVEHRQVRGGRETTHTVRVTPGSRLAGILADGEELAVNSFHHQGADRLGRGLRPVAYAADGSVEGLEDPGSLLALGVQWHAETLIDRPEHLRLFEALVDAAQAYAARVDAAGRLSEAVA
jgi:putative glutamine amidotransferase